MKTMKTIVLCLMLIPLMVHAEPALDIPDRLAGQLSTQPAKGKVPVYAISMEIGFDGSTLNKNVGILAGETAVLSFMDDGGQGGYEIRINTPEHTNLLGGVPYGKMNVMVLDMGARKEILAEPVLMSPLNGDKVQVELGGSEGEGLLLAMWVKQFYIDAAIADAEKKNHLCASDTELGRKTTMDYPWGNENCCGGYCTIGPYRKYQCCGVVWCCICGPCCQVK